MDVGTFGSLLSEDGCCCLVRILVFYFRQANSCQSFLQVVALERMHHQTFQEHPLWDAIFGSGNSGATLGLSESSYNIHGI